MLQHFRKYIASQKLFTKSNKLLVAVSGGMDSVILCHLLNQSGYKFAIAHCNFQLRGKESDADEKFVNQLAVSFNASCYIRKFNIQEYSKDKGISIQMAARYLRYAWFEEVRMENKYDYIVVAHHQDDEIETFFINLIRGTGIAGLHGIKTKSGRIMRPLMFTGRKEIEEFVKKNKIKYREDSSNSSTKYLRNKIRLQLIPLLKKLNPEIENAVLSDIQRIRKVEDFFQERVEEKKNEIVIDEGNFIKFNIDKILSLSHKELFLFEFLKPYGFTGDTIGQISVALKAQPGKQFLSVTHRLVKDRKFLLLFPFEKNNSEQEYIITEGCNELKIPIVLKFKKTEISDKFKVVKSTTVGMFDYSKLKFPLTIRKWKAGDFFYPHGMKGKKKLSDFFTDLKLSLHHKENVWLLCNGEDIIWVIGLRPDNRYRVNDNSEKIFIAELIRE